jgi:hypothetical protein
MDKLSEFRRMQQSVVEFIGGRNPEDVPADEVIRMLAQRFPEEKKLHEVIEGFKKDNALKILRLLGRYARREGSTVVESIEFPKNMPTVPDLIPSENPQPAVPEKKAEEQPSASQPENNRWNLLRRWFKRD